MKYLLLFACAVFAQSISMNSMEPPKTELFYSKESPASGDTLYLKVIIPQDWHINANKVLDEFLVPSSIELVAGGIKFGPILWPEPAKVHNEVLGIDLLLLQDTFVVSVPVVSVPKNSNPYNVKLNFTYQACSNICLPPKTMEVGFGDPVMEKKKSYDRGVSRYAHTGFLMYILLAIFGGVILNFMPCVLPVLFLKIFDLMKKSGESRRNVLGWGLATTGGVLFSFLAIALAICLIRLTGQAVGWGFQFQHPAYTAAMALGIMVFALSLWGLFDIWMPGNVLKVWEKESKSSSFRGAFAYGILLVLLSTPCSAPFLGTAVAFAFSASFAELFAIFIAIGLGLSAPYLILSIFPQWTKKLPRPGHWMVRVKQLLAIPLFLTVAWLVWVFHRQMGTEPSIRLSVFLFLAVFFAWLSGAHAKPGKPWARFCALWLVFVAIYAVSWNLWINPQNHHETYIRPTDEKSDWTPFSARKLDSLQSEGYAIWVNGTADWCLTCKVNEKNVFEDEKVKKIFAETPIIKMQADYTKPNYEALKFFEKYNRNSVPFDLLLTSYGESILLPELLTVDAAVEALGKAY